METNAARNEVKVMVAIDLAAICRKLAENSVVPDNLRAKARELVEEFDSLPRFRGKATPTQFLQGEVLLMRMARFLPRIVEMKSCPVDFSNL